MQADSSEEKETRERPLSVHKVYHPAPTLIYYSQRSLIPLRSFSNSNFLNELNKQHLCLYISRYIDSLATHGT